MKYWVIFVIIIICIGGGVFLGTRLDSNILKQENKIDITYTVKEILPIAEYASLVYHYSTVITESDVRRLFGISIPLTDRRAIYTIDGTIKLGFSGRDITITNQNNIIIVHMPKIKILSHEIYPETFSLYDERTSLFNRYSLQDANNLQMEHKREFERKVNENEGLFFQAQQSAEQQFRFFLENIPEVKEKYRIVFEWEM
ncbi:MAG: DUF4230 domain-containing protein [Treponema sp.]|nr:DUF4230 domain-containing protein [Treponema sp.]